jgi:transcriptional regulator with PAS, ATPase and Fis domain
VNAGALPDQLLEAELFGTESGAFTGAKARAGRFEAADGGTLFLDEIGNLPLAGQAKLLRVLQTGEYERLGSNTTRRANVRIVAATNLPLREAMRAGKFREDLYYRISVIELTLPPLAERRDDILPLARAFLGKNVRLTGDAERALLNHSWPGNVRELRNALQRAALLAGENLINAAALNLPAVLPARFDEPVLDRATIERVLAEHGHIVAQAARQLGISRQALYRRMEKLGIKESPGAFERSS